MQAATKRVDLAVIGIPIKKIETVKAIFQTLNETLKLEVQELKEVEFKETKNNLQALNKIMGSVEMDALPAQEDIKIARTKKYVQ